MSEYLVEVGGGRQLRYETLHAFRSGIRNGEIAADARIYHRATSTWVSITKHPEYRKIQAENPPPLLQPEDIADPEAPTGRGTPPTPGLRQLGKRMAATWAILKQRLAPRRAASPPRPNAPPGRPGTAAPPQEPQASDPTRDRWTFYS